MPYNKKYGMKTGYKVSTKAKAPKRGKRSSHMTKAKVKVKPR